MDVKHMKILGNEKCYFGVWVVKGWWRYTQATMDLCSSYSGIQRLVSLAIGKMISEVHVNILEETSACKWVVLKELIYVHTLNGFHNWFYQVIKIKFRSKLDLVVMNTYASNGLNMILSPWHCSFGKWTIKIIKDVYMWNSLMPHKISNDIINGANEVWFRVRSKDDEYNCIQVFNFVYDLIMKSRWMDGCDWWMKTSTCEHYHHSMKSKYCMISFLFGCVTSLVSCFLLHSLSFVLCIINIVLFFHWLFWCLFKHFHFICLTLYASGL
jgi:hypothetical protein